MGYRRKEGGRKDRERGGGKEKRRRKGNTLIHFITLTI